MTKRITLLLKSENISFAKKRTKKEENQYVKNDG